jgi:integrase/recombinase XerD
MRVQRVVMRDSEEESWTLLGEDHGQVESVERFLSYLVSIESRRTRSRPTPMI